MNLVLPFFQVDAFAAQSFSGNPAAVMILEKFLADDVLQKIAVENNLSETAFLVQEDNKWLLRWFTPGFEVDLCGHATLAAAHVLFSEGLCTASTVVFSTRSGNLSVQKSDEIYELIFPADEIQATPPPDFLAKALGLSVLEYYRGKDDFIAVVAHEAQVAQLKPDFAAIANLESRGLIVTAPGDKLDFVSRCFYPQAGINEDPVTGSAHTALIPYWTKRLGKKTLSARQISPRGGNINGWQAADKVYLQGKALSVIKGFFTIH